MTGMVEKVFETIGDAITGFFSVLNNGLKSVVELFYSTGTADGVEAGFTFLGTVLLIGLGVGLVWTLIGWISGLVRNSAR